MGRALSEVSRGGKVMGAVFGKITDSLRTMGTAPPPHAPACPRWVSRAKNKNTGQSFLFHCTPTLPFSLQMMGVGWRGRVLRPHAHHNTSAEETPVGPLQAQTGLRPGFKPTPPPRGKGRRLIFFHAQERIQLGAGLFPKLSLLD